MDTEKISFHIISYAGDSFSKMREALSEAKLGNFQKADELMSSAKKTLTEAHNAHTEVITLEAQGEKSEYSVLLAHAQDTLMNAILAEKILEEFIELYKNK